MSEIQRIGVSAGWSEAGTGIFCRNGDFSSSDRVAFTSGVSDVMLHAVGILFLQDGYSCPSHALATMSKQRLCIGVQALEDESGKTVVKIED